MVRHDRKAQLAQMILDNRRDRRDYIPSDLFGELAWEALLHLFIADAASDRLTGHCLVKRVGCTNSVMSRWLMYLSQQGLVIGDGEGDLSDLLNLARKAIDAVEIYLDQTQLLAQQLLENGEI